MLACSPSGLHRVFMQAVLFPMGPDGDLADLIGDGHASPVGPSGPPLDFSYGHPCAPVSSMRPQWVPHGGQLRSPCVPRCMVPAGHVLCT
jgi:hypothetical protein